MFGPNREHAERARSGFNRACASPLVKPHRTLLRWFRRLDVETRCGFKADWTHVSAGDPRAGVREPLESLCLSLHVVSGRPGAHGGAALALLVCLGVTLVVAPGLAIGSLTHMPGGESVGSFGLPVWAPADAARSAASAGVGLLAGYSAAPGAWNVTVPLNFSAPLTPTEVFYVWAIEGNYAAYSAPSLPLGMSVKERSGGVGIAVGNLSAGNYSTRLNYSGYTNIVTVAVYAVSAGSADAYAFGAAAATSLTLPAGQGVFIGVETTGGTYPVLNSSITNITEEAPAIDGGQTGIIGLQGSNAFRFNTSGGSGIAGAGVYSSQNGPGAPSGGQGPAPDWVVPLGVGLGIGGAIGSIGGLVLGRRGRPDSRAPNPFEGGV